MKKTILAAGLVAFALASCSKDDDAISTSKLMKKWYYESEVVGGETIPYDDNEDCGKDYIEFLEGGIAHDVDVYMCDEYSTDATWEVHGNKLTLTEDGYTVTGTVSKLNSTTLEIKTKFDYDDDGTDDTVTERFTSIP